MELFMPAPYSKDLRSKVIEAYQSGEGTQAEIAERFKLCLLTVKRYWKRYQETGAIEAKQDIKTGRRPSVFGAAAEQRLLDIVEKHPDATLEELCVIYNKKKGIKSVIPVVMHRTLKRLCVKRKKKSHYAQEQDRPDVQLKRENFKKRNF